MINFRLWACPNRDFHSVSPMDLEPNADQAKVRSRHVIRIVVCVGRRRIARRAALRDAK